MPRPGHPHPCPLCSHRLLTDNLPPDLPQQRPHCHGPGTPAVPSTFTLSLTSGPRAAEVRGALGGAGMGAGRLGEPAPAGEIRGTLRPTPCPGARPAGITGWTAPGTEAELGLLQRHQAPTLWPLGLQTSAWAPPALVDGQADRASPGGCPPHLFLPWHQPTGRTHRAWWPCRVWWLAASPLAGTPAPQSVGR